MDIELIADTAPEAETFETGGARTVDLMRRLARMPEFADGWLGSTDMALADDNEDEFLAIERREVGPDAEALGSYFLVAGREAAAGEEGSGYLLNRAFGRPNGFIPPHVAIQFGVRHANLSFATRLIGVLLEWGRVQHVGIADRYYRFEDSPLDARRRGLGWAGWVPFRLTRAQVPEAEALEPLGTGTFLSASPTWATSGDVPIPEAQALELRLNALGVLPSFDDLFRGDWGDRSPQR